MTPTDSFLGPELIDHDLAAKLWDKYPDLIEAKRRKKAKEAMEFEAKQAELLSGKLSDSDKEIILKARRAAIEVRINRVREWNIDRIEGLLDEDETRKPPVDMSFFDDMNKDWGFDIVKRQMKADFFFKL